MKYQDVLLVSDIDGTLLNEKLSTPEINVKAIEDFVAKGGRFAIATGRAPLSAGYVTSFIEKKTPCVVFNGGGIYDFAENKLLWQLTLHDSSVEIAKYVYDNAPFASVEIHVGSKIYLARSSPRGEVHVGQAGTEVIRCSFDEIPTTGWNKVLFAAEPEGEIPQLVEMLKGFENSGCSLLLTSPYYYEIIPLGVSKAEAMFRLADILGVLHENVFAIGDYFNDLEMIKAASVSACVESSPDELKKIADVICPDVNGGSVAHFINKIETEYIN